MAAHILNMLKDFQSGTYTMEQINQALQYTAAPDDLEFDEWSDIFYATSIKEIVTIVTIIIPKYEKIWKLLGEPRNQEEWHNAYFHTVKTVRKHAVVELKYTEMYKRIWDADRKHMKADIAY